MQIYRNKLISWENIVNKVKQDSPISKKCFASELRIFTDRDVLRLVLTIHFLTIHSRLYPSPPKKRNRNTPDKKKNNTSVLALPSNSNTKVLSIVNHSSTTWNFKSCHQLFLILFPRWCFRCIFDTDNRFYHIKHFASF